MKKTLREIVTEIIDYLDSEPVSSINDTSEAFQIARIVERTYYNLFKVNTLPEHKQLVNLVVNSDNTYPTHLKVPDDVIHLDNVWYDVENDPSKPRNYKEICYLKPLEFLYKTDRYQGDIQIVPDKHANTDLRIRRDKHPDFYTSFDDEWIVFDSFDSSVDDTIQASKLRGYATVIPAFQLTDDFIPDIDINMFPVLVEEAKSVAFEILKGFRSQKVEQSARRNRYLYRPDKQSVGRYRLWNNYGRSV